MTLAAIQKPAHPMNYGPRHGSPVTMIVLHTTQGTAAAALRHFADPSSQVSAHYLVCQDGRLYQCVPTASCAWHAGNQTINRRSIGIECEGDCNDPGMWTPELLRTLDALATDLVLDFPIPVHRAYILGHAEVPDPDHPGQFGGAHHHADPEPHFNWPRLMAALGSTDGRETT